MPLLVTCGACGKQLKVRDELVGKKLKCPQCQNVFEASAMAGPLPVPPRVRPQGPRKQVAFEIPWDLILKLSPVILMVAIGFLVYFGPVRVRDQFNASADGMRNEVSDVLVRGMMCNMQQIGQFDPNSSHYMPEAHFQLFAPMLAMSMPESIDFLGAIGTGVVSGKFNTKTHQVRATVQFPGRNKWGRIDGSLPPERAPIQITGRSFDGQLAVEVDGRPATLRVNRNAPGPDAGAGLPPPLKRLGK